MFELLKIGNF